MRRLFSKIDIVPISLCLFAIFYFQISLNWIFLFLAGWLVFRLFWFYRRAVNEGLFD